MATVLETYEQDKQELVQRMAQRAINADILWRYGELVYRIGVLETCQAYCRSAPVCRDMPSLMRHYQMLDAYIQNLALERSYGPDRGPDTEKERDAARTNVRRVLEDYRNRFCRFAPSSDTAYSQEISRVVNTVMPVWLQLRETFVPLRKEKSNGNR